jgi:hypothetical protein
MKRKVVQAMINKRVAEVALSADEVLARIAEIATSNPADFITLDPEGQPRFDLTRAQRSGKLRLIKRIIPSKHGVSIELHDPLSALTLLGRYHNLWDNSVGSDNFLSTSAPRINPRRPGEWININVDSTDEEIQLAIDQAEAEVVQAQEKSRAWAEQGKILLEERRLAKQAERERERERNRKEFL